MIGMNIGDRLKQRRRAAGFSQRELARRSGMTNGFISQIEKNQVSPSVASLKKLLNELSTSLTDFFADGQAIQTTFYSRNHELPVVAQGSFHYQQIGYFRTDRAIDMRCERLKSGADRRIAQSSFVGEVCAVVLKGQLELTLDDEVIILDAGDSYYFDRAQAHRFRNLNDDDCELISAALTRPI
ncbi:helix-turn-helix domain-containing protein [Celerinatantimonas yamalensis]|uniref:Helix-turn-helix domain-containing protein n=1 Tax=Celerinatantimonas yamalensis TaxID=559956 RepID=A0ABW9G9H4_9GAMM